MNSRLAATIVFLLAPLSFAKPPDKVTNREFEDGTGSSKVVDADNRKAIETFYDVHHKPSYKIVYRLDERMQPLSGVYYNNAGRIFQKSNYKLDGADRIIQEIVFDANDKLYCTKNYIYGTRAGRDYVVDVETWDSNGNLMSRLNTPAARSKRRR